MPWTHTPVFLCSDLWKVTTFPFWNSIHLQMLKRPRKGETRRASSNVAPGSPRKRWKFEMFHTHLIMCLELDGSTPDYLFPACVQASSGPYGNLQPRIWITSNVVFSQYTLKQSAEKYDRKNDQWSGLQETQKREMSDSFHPQS